MMYSIRLHDHHFLQLLYDREEGAIIALDGIDLETLSITIRADETFYDNRRLLFTTLTPSQSPGRIVAELLRRLADVALRMWPMWLDGKTFISGGKDTLARLAVIAMAQKISASHRNMLGPWLEKAALLAMKGCPPRVAGTPAQIELGQLSTLVSPAGLTLVTQVPNKDDVHMAEFVHAIEWIARHLRGSVIVLFPEAPTPGSVLERIHHGAVTVDGTQMPPRTLPLNAIPAKDLFWLEPWRGSPHPLSDVEQRMHQLITADPELKHLFCFNHAVETVRGSSLRVDMLWRAGQLVVEFDGYADHGTRVAFSRDRQRDFELVLSGYKVLRITNDEVQQDSWLAMEKIRDLVNQCRATSQQEA